MNEETEPEEAGETVQGHSAGKWQSGDLNSDLPDPKSLQAGAPQSPVLHSLLCLHRLRLLRSSHRFLLLVILLSQ